MRNVYMTLTWLLNNGHFNRGLRFWSMCEGRRIKIRLLKELGCDGDSE